MADRIFLCSVLPDPVLFFRAIIMIARVREGGGDGTGSCPGSFAPHRLAGGRGGGGGAGGAAGGGGRETSGGGAGGEVAGARRRVPGAGPDLRGVRQCPLEAGAV